MAENINGIVKVVNDGKEVILKLEDIFDISEDVIKIEVCTTSFTVSMFGMPPRPNPNINIPYNRIYQGFFDQNRQSLFPVYLSSDYKNLDLIYINGQKIVPQNPNDCQNKTIPTENGNFDFPLITTYEKLDSYILTIHIEPEYIFYNDNDFNILKLCLILTKTDHSEEYKYLPIYITKNTINSYKIYDKQTQMIASNMESFMLLRTNPKLTGNVKLVVDEDYNLYLDTFKISNNSILNKQEYRHQAISADGNYPYDVYRIFKFMPATEMYGIYPDSYDPHISYHKTDDQIRNIYEYGAEYNSDKLYSENMKILAPLYIGKHLPDYFVIWRSDRLITDDNTVTNSDVFKQLLNDGECIKIVDLRRSTTIGKYLHSYQEMIIKYLAGTCALQFIEQDNDKNSIDHRQGQNTWKGIAYDKGILTDRNETTYFATQTLEGEAPQENFDIFLLNGYSRNKLLFPNIINLEYMFNDKNVQDYTMHNYFGLYLTENDFITFNQVIKTKVDADNYDLKYFDTSNNLVNINALPIDVIEDEEFKDRIFFASTKNNAANLKDINDLNVFTKNYAVNMPNENIVQMAGKEFKFADNEKAFLSLDFTKPIKYGEHFKFIIPKYNGENKCIVFEIIASNDKRLKSTTNNISPYVQTNIPDRLSEIENEEPTEIYRVAFYSQDLNDETKSAELNDQILRIGNAIKKFDNVLKVGSDGDESISIISSVKDVYFQHILVDEFIETRQHYSVETESLTTYETYDNTIYVNDISVNDTLRYYNYNNIQKCEYIEYNNDLFGIHHIGYANNGLEETCERYDNITKFINIEDFNNNFVYEIDKDIYEETHNILYPLIYTENGYYPMVKFSNNNADLTYTDSSITYVQGHTYITIIDTSVSEFSLNSQEFISIISPYDVNKSIICSPYKIEYVNEKINICSPLQMNIALMGINDIKDIDVYIDNEIIEQHNTEVSSTFIKGERVKLDNTDSRLRKFITYSIISGSVYGIPTSELNSFTILNDCIIYTNANNEDIIESIPLTTDYIEFDEDTTIMLVSTNSLDIYNYTVNYPLLSELNYYTDTINTEKSGLNIPLVPLINCQWKSNGYYFDTVSILDVNDLINDYDIVGNFIECKYTPAQNNQYIIDSLDDIINVNGENSDIYTQILKTGSIKKYLCANSKIETAIGYYNPYVQTLEFIFYGIKFIFKLTSNEYLNEIKLNEFDNYEVFILNDYNNLDTNEIIISKKEEFILIINHAYKSTYYYGNSNIKTYKDNIIQDVDYDWFKSPYTYEMPNISYLNDKIYATKSISYTMDTQDVNTFVEIDLNKYDSEYTDFGEEPVFAYFIIDDTFKTYNNYDLYDSSTKFYMNDIENYQNTIKCDINLLSKYYFDVNVDFRQKNGYVIKHNDTPIDEMESITYENKLNDYINSFNSNLNIHIIENDNTEVQTIKITKDYKPLTIEMIKPNKVKFNNGLFNPSFINIFDFKLNDTISEKIGLDTLYGNTCVSSINSIKNYYSNKVIANQSNYTYNYFIDENRSPFSTNWDNNIYRQYTDNDTFDYLLGYSLGVDDKMFFGSKALNLHNSYILLDKWNYTSNVNVASYNISKQNEHTKQKTVLEISLNLTKTFYDYFVNNENFVNNWANIKKNNANQTNTKIYINNYINNVLYNLYNFKGNFNVALYKQYNELLQQGQASEHFILEQPSLNEFEIDQNYKTEFKDINNEVILVITISDFKNYIYYPIVKINKI